MFNRAPQCLIHEAFKHLEGPWCTSLLGLEMQMYVRTCPDTGLLVEQVSSFPFLLLQ